MKLKHYSFTVEVGNDDIIELLDENGKRYTFTISHPGFVRFANNVRVIAMDSTNRIDFLKEEYREN